MVRSMCTVIAAAAVVVGCDGASSPVTTSDPPTIVETTTTEDRPPTTSTTTMAVTTTTAAATTTTEEVTTTTAAVTTSTVAVDAELLFGTWVTERRGYLLTFTEEGIHEVAYLTGPPFDFGPFVLDGNQVTFVIAEGSEACAVGTTGVYTVAISADGQELSLEWVSDECSERAADLASSVLERFEP